MNSTLNHSNTVVRRTHNKSSTMLGLGIKMRDTTTIKEDEEFEDENHSFLYLLLKMMKGIHKNKRGGLRDSGNYDFDEEHSVASTANTEYSDVAFRDNKCQVLTPFINWKLNYLTLIF